MTANPASAFHKKDVLVDCGKLLTDPQRLMSHLSPLARQVFFVPRLIHHKPSLYSFALFLLAFFLFLEWLRPLRYIGNTGALELILLFTMFVFLLAYLQPPLWLTLPLVLFAMLYVLHNAHFADVPLMAVDWLRVVIADFANMFVLLMALEWGLISDVVRTALLLILLSLMGYLMKHWLLHVRNAFAFIVITVVYVAVLDTFTLYDATFAIIRIVVFGFILTGLLEVAKVQEREGFETHLHFPVKWIFFVTVMIFIVSLAGFLAPKAGPQWADPVPFIKSAAGLKEEASKQPYTQRIGYGSNDSRLGGPFQMDDTPIFSATTEEVHYWRAETKDVYTGKGWESSDGVTVALQDEAKNLYEAGVMYEEKRAKIEMTGEASFPFLFYSPLLTNVDTSAEDVVFQKNVLTRKITSLSGDEEIALEEYTLTYNYPTFSIEHLREESGSNYPAEIRERYLQLPDTLPNRVKELALDITEERESAYEKAEAIESFFSRHGYTYDTKDVAVPGRDDDYVDQFLFETKRGYCDNFSTSMVVMLRSIGIPARWVKGFTQGDYEKTLKDETRRYVITNEHAHSWVEVYFPDAGWVPFEPTRGFSNPSSLVQSFDSETVTGQDEEEQEEEEREEEMSEEAISSDESKASLSSGSVDGTVVVLIILLFICFTILVANYKRLAKGWVLFRFKTVRHHETAFEKAYEWLIWLLSVYGYERRPEQTLREYAIDIDQVLRGNHMRNLTKLYEARLYDEKERDVIADDYQEMWLNVVRHLKS